MKKRIFLLFVPFISCGLRPSFSQNLQRGPLGNHDPIGTSGPLENRGHFGNFIQFHFLPHTKKTMMWPARGIVFNVPDTALYRVPIMPNNTFMMGVKLGPRVTNYALSPVKSFSKSYPHYLISDSSDAIVIGLGITKDNVNDYRYHVVENDSAELVHWSVPQLQQHYGAKQPYGFIGKFKDIGKQLLVEIVNIKNYAIRDGVVFDWRVNFKPVVTKAILHRQADVSFSNILESVRKFFDPDLPDEDNNFDRRFDQLKWPVKKFSVHNINTLELFFEEHEQIPYLVYLANTDGKSRDYSVDNAVLENKCAIDMSAFQPGKYDIVIARRLPGGYRDTTKELHIPLTILPLRPMKFKVLLMQSLPYLEAAIIGAALIFWLYRRRSKRKLARSIQARQTINLKLRSIRAQLNPHFMFNALTSIQNLMNKNDTKSANHYLAKFAELTRKVLNTSDQELISLEDEVKILDDYLLMEQLRFNFQYELKIDDKINLANTEVPPMLLQPFVENAVKHGVANLREKGVIRVLISLNDNNLQFSISDNGPGFQQNNANYGEGAYGLKLSEERIKLLNEVYTGQFASLNITSNASGTTVVIVLINWIS